MKKLSIIIPVYNAEKYLIQCLESIVNKCSNTIEIIIVDDGSTDSSKDICKHYVNENIKLYCNTNHGVSYSRNYGIQKANGKYIMFVDADDVLKENWLDIIQQSTMNNYDYDIIYYNNKIDPKKVKEEMNLLNYIIANNDEGICIGGPFSKIFRRNFLLKNNIKFKDNIINGEDMLFNVEALLASGKIKVENKSFYLYRINIGSATKKYDKKIVESDKIFHKELESIFKAQKLDNNQTKEILQYCKYNAVITIVERISFMDKFKNAKVEYSFLDEEPYKSIIKDDNFKNNKNKLIMKMCKGKNLLLLYLTLKLKNKVVSIVRKKFEFIEI